MLKIEIPKSRKSLLRNLCIKLCGCSRLRHPPAQGLNYCIIGYKPNNNNNEVFFVEKVQSANMSGCKQAPDNVRPARPAHAVLIVRKGLREVGVRSAPGPAAAPAVRPPGPQ
ncbi:hypothetical protein GDO81_013629 [Engystomops pustulosus]|uniref:Uncharacterized protein n=1 Tax=Engystomops pustulosus TaxID=76066 RepID=A0AAV7B2P1_ENGPU|nr:hypothetical protein GDO81_013629 [Engystomops pustulosus]